jgi:hypothetical protein
MRLNVLDAESYDVQERISLLEWLLLESKRRRGFWEMLFKTLREDEEGSIFVSEP